MKQYLIWLLFLQLRTYSSEYLDYSDYHPENIPMRNGDNLRSRNREHKAVVRSLYNNAQSPIPYLKTRRYVPANNVEEAANFDEPNDVPLKGENYFFFPDNKPRSLRDNLVDEEDSTESEIEEGSTNVAEVTTNSTSSPSQNDTTGIIGKVKDKFLNIFKHKDEKEKDPKSPNSDLSDWNYDLSDQELIDDYGYEIPEKGLFVRAAGKPPMNATLSDELFNDLTDTDIQYIKTIINCFKRTRNEFKVDQPPMAANKTSKSNSASSPKANLNPDKAKSNAGQVKKVKKPGVKGKPFEASTESVTATSDCITVPTSISQPTTNISIEASTTTTSPNLTNLEGIGNSDDITLDLDINGTGEDTKFSSNFDKCTCTSTPPTMYPSTSPLENRKYFTKVEFLAHRHHTVDEIGKLPYKRLDLANVQDVIDKSKYSTVTMGDGNATECTPLQLNGMSFDLEWNKINKPPKPLTHQTQAQSLAAKFLQDVNKYTEEYVNPPISDNLLPAKTSSKREAFLKSGDSSRKLSKLLADISARSEDAGDDYIYMEDTKPFKRRTRVRVKGRKKKKPKKYKETQSESLNPSDLDAVNIAVQDSDDVAPIDPNDFNSFDEFKDIQFRVNDNDEQAISTFISNLNSPPEVFTFDVDKYLRSAKSDLQPQTTEYEFKPPKQRTYFEFMETPAIDKERLPLIEAPSDVDGPTNSRSPPEKRDLLRQYIKGVSSALNRNHPEAYSKYNTATEGTSEIIPNFSSDTSYQTNNLVNDFSVNLDAMNSIKSEGQDDLLDNYYFLNDGSSQIYDLSKQNPNVIPNDKYSPQSLDIDLDLNKKFRNLDMASYDNRRWQELPDGENAENTVESNYQVENDNVGSYSNEHF